MKSNSGSGPLRSFWLAISDVPGWPDAPTSVRMRRLWPLLLPLAGIVAMLGWDFGIRRPHMRNVRASHSYLLAMEADLAALRQACSDQTAAEVAARMDEAEKSVMASPEELPALMSAFAAHARSLGWSLDWQAYELTDEDGGDGPGRTYVPARLKLAPLPDAREPFPALVTILDDVSRTGRRIDVTRVSIRADEPGLPVVDANIRVICRATHEKAPQ